MVDLSRRLAAEKENVDKALANLDDALTREEQSAVELAAIGTFLHNMYSGIENMLKQIVKDRGKEIPTSDTWHKDLLELATSEAIVSERLADLLYEYLTFRHFFVHAYGFMLKEDHVSPLATNASNVWKQFLSEIGKYCTIPEVP